MLTSEKVRLRPKRLDDVYRDYLWGQDPELAELDGSYPLHLPFADYYRLYAKALKNPEPDFYHFAIETIEGKHIGNCMIYRIEKGRGELGIMIGERDYWNQGYGSEAIKLLLDFIFTNTKLEKIFLYTLPENRRAQKCFIKCGFVPLGYKIRNGKSFLFMEIDRPHWEQEKRATS